MYERDPRLLERIRAPFIKEMKTMHFGQVVAIEEVARILSLCNSAVRLPCGCRRDGEIPDSEPNVFYREIPDEINDPTGVPFKKRE